jgi:crotonobetainyl-CoA:carnitine CoA-transferase CaiB-like acyl-CoA transferase
VAAQSPFHEVIVEEVLASVPAEIASRLRITPTVGGLNAAFALLAALFHRERTGEGQFIDVALLDSIMPLAGWVAANLLIGKQQPVLMGNDNFTAAPSGVFKTKDGYITISGSQTVPTLSKVLGLPNLAEDPRFDTFWKRVNNRGEMDAVIEAALAQKTTAEWMELMEEADLWASPVNSFPQAFSDPQVLHNEMVLTVDSPVGRLKMPGFPYKLSRTPAQVRMPPPLLGQHTEEILQSAGYTRAEIAAFRDAEVI